MAILTTDLLFKSQKNWWTKRLILDQIKFFEHQLSTAAAGQNMLLAFHEMGFGGIWRTGKFSFNREISMELDLKENEIVIGYLYIGTIEGKTKKIPELNSEDFVIRWE